MPTFRYDPASGLIRPAHQHPSPNQDARPAGVAVDALIIHGISLPPGAFGGPWIDRLFTNRLPADAHPYFARVHRLRVSCHLLIRRDGALTQYVPLHRRAWHAGQSRLAGRERCNDFAIGIELEGTDETPYTEAQYQVLGPLCRTLMAAFPGITPERVVGHSDVAPGRKTDPGPAFDWARLRAALHA
ncbi:1,6-anhydro-N-acetylmuramyl-L-alanine amidase AmpD [Alkalilimnicola ehrlichii MLHE-1]|uniref:1,6-anhydro-N-acetylmuramyl-L-alanine amidase AmpD n=1 Tax=Alkalilimnicola ehrlichii (strain ATCC BAA-1101 / DSM 17681 / MLHE-1) TaxID=187272 RepID=Q0AC58_ALKEH|nr:1,6-anhydro-N-acetylmuramyl-L-alanine amidase AmpD [Alkalilimnicola ehrlichii]ABI55579.1 N-acetylmuramyl-L-alanine amidase, negative regulator of AmpC, AmpD [Alkalilimnicola ehrlichii MLHE-1]